MSIQKPDDEDDIIKDGQHLKVPMMLMDSNRVDPAVYGEFYANLKGASVMDAAMQPRSGVFTDAQRQSIEDAHAKYRERISNAWRDAPPDREQQELYTSPGLMNALAKVPVDRLRSKDDARLAYEERLRNAWRDA